MRFGGGITLLTGVAANLAVAFGYFPHIEQSQINTILLLGLDMVAWSNTSKEG